MQVGKCGYCSLFCSALRQGKLFLRNAIVKILRTFWPLLIIEFCNVILANLLRPSISNAFHPALDGLSVFVTLGVVFAAGWLAVTRYAGSIVIAGIAGLLLWMFSMILIVPEMLFGAYSESLNAGASRLQTTIVSILLGSVWLVPVTVVIGTLGGLAGKLKERKEEKVG
jgi:hypothetical protein